MLGLHVACWGPLILVVVLEYTIHIAHIYITVASMLVAVHSALNFVVYAAMNRQFRAAFKKMFGCQGSHRVDDVVVNVNQISDGCMYQGSSGVDRNNVKVKEPSSDYSSANNIIA